ncbi:MAG: hypothetical protein OHK0037_15340 [Elainellaceae cyanobacterium]
MINHEEVVLTCPKCTNESFVRCEHSTEDVFECVNCGHRKVLNQPQTSDFKTILFALLTGLALTLSLLSL